MNAMLNMRFHRLRHTAIQSILRTWPFLSRKIARAIMHSYGLPHEATETMLIWHYNGPWKRTVVHRTGVQHNVPHRHVDILEQTIDAKISPDTCSEIMKFDGSIIIDRTRGEMTAYCESEHANILLLNLAHDIALRTKTADEARKILLDSSALLRSTWPNPYKENLQFTSTIQASDPDMVTAEPN